MPRMPGCAGVRERTVRTGGGFRRPLLITGADADPAPLYRPPGLDTVPFPGDRTTPGAPGSYAATGSPAARHAWNPPARSVARCRPSRCRDSAARLEA
ncbi:hypothetical protein GCM10010421_51690 [Streptomyces glaucus]|uniref:Uncharacterized protein n=1 Tax=Streptomyces glaucus TaxID=284029 RepID=A0ABN3K8F1_9ACTN